MRHQAACTHSCHCTGTSVQSSELLPGTLDSSPCVVPDGKLGLDWASLCTGVGPLHLPGLQLLGPASLSLSLVILAPGAALRPTRPFHASSSVFIPLKQWCFSPFCSAFIPRRHLHTSLEAKSCSQPDLSPGYFRTKREAERAKKRRKRETHPCPVRV